MIAAVLVASGCARGAPDDSSTEAVAPTTDTTAGGTPASIVDAGPDDARSNPATPGTSTSVAPVGATSDQPAPEAASFEVVARIDDRAGDHGLGAPPHADARVVELAGNDRTARITVTMAGAIPETLEENEIQGVGVDLFAPGNTNPRLSDAQVFALGDSDGWYGYLSVGKGDAEPLPGALIIDGRTLVFELSWDDLRAPATGRISAFVDFGRDAEPLNVTGEDHVPDLGTSPYERTVR